MLTLLPRPWISLLVLLVVAPLPAAAQEVTSHPWTPGPPERPVVLMDYYHHQPPEQSLGAYETTGSYTTPVGRYGLNDFSHTNSFAPLAHALERDYALRVHRGAPFSEQVLDGVDIVLIFTPDSPNTTPNANVISDAEIDVLDQFVRDGGTVLAMLNGFAKFEPFETEQTHKLINRFGIDWREMDTGHPEPPLGRAHPWFYDIDRFHYGGGCLFDFQDNAPQPRVLLDAAGDPDFPDVAGPAIVMTRPGAGKFIAVGDTGSWTANLDRTYTQNVAVLRQLFGHARPDRGVPMPRYAVDDTHRYALTMTQVSVLNAGAFEDLSWQDFSVAEPRETTRIPYRDTSGEIVVSGADVNDDGTMRLNARIAQLRHDGQTVANAADDAAALTVSRLGELADVRASQGDFEQRVPDMPALVGFVPNDAIQPGDRWRKTHRLAVPTVSADVPAPVRDVPAETVYVRDEQIEGRACRRLMTKAAAPLNALDLTVGDLAPPAHQRRWAGPGWRFTFPGGGRYLLRLEQWIDQQTGVVVRSQVQSRVVVWVTEQLPAGSADDMQPTETVITFARKSRLRLE